MTISSTTSKNQYVANGTNDTFTYTFKIYDEADIKVLSDDTVKTLNTDYTVTGVGNDAGGSVVYVTDPVADTIVTLKRNEPLTQEIEYVEGDDFPAAAHEEGLDRSAIRDQFLQEQIDRALLLPPFTTATSFSLTDPTGNGGKLLILNDDEDAIEYVEIVNTLDGVVIAPGDAGKFIVVNTTEDGFELNASAIPDGDKGDITVSGGGAAWTIDSNAVSAGKIGTDASAIRSKIGLGAVTYPLMNYGGMNFDGSTDYLDGNALTGIADGKKGSFFAVVRFANASGTAETIMASQDNAITIEKQANGTLRFLAENSGGTIIMECRSTAAVFASAGTYIIAASWDMAVSGSFKLYINDVDIAYTQTTFTDDTIDYTVAEYSIGARHTGTNKFVGDIYSVWFDPTSAIDWDIEANRRKFTDANLVPIFLGANGELPTGTSPILFLGYDEYTSWIVNKGTSTSSFTANGTQAEPASALNGQYGVLSSFTSATAQTTTSGTAINFVNIPSWAKQIIVAFSGVSTNGTSPLLVQLGDAGGYETSGYISEASVGTLSATSTAGFLIASGTLAAADVKTGALTLTRLTGNTWVASGAITYGAAGSGFVVSSAGSKTTSASTDRLRITATNGTDTFDAGTINIIYS